MPANADGQRLPDGQEKNKGAEEDITPAIRAA